MCTYISETDDESARMNKAMRGLEECAENWAKSANVRHFAERISGDPDKIEDMLINCFVEGCWYGRRSLIAYLPKCEDVGA